MIYYYFAQRYEMVINVIIFVNRYSIIIASALKGAHHRAIVMAYSHENAGLDFRENITSIMPILLFLISYQNIDIAILDSVNYDKSAHHHSHQILKSSIVIARDYDASKPK